MDVRTLKQKLKAMASSTLPLHWKVQEMLMRYRSTRLSCGKFPSELYLKRRILLKPPPRPSPQARTWPN
ncbi:hypothetical protein ILUMI_13751, partial [Ignelater luminosus]